MAWRVAVYAREQVVSVIVARSTAQIRRAALAVALLSDMASEQGWCDSIIIYERIIYERISGLTFVLSAMSAMSYVMLR
jgi:hypothetical protein